MRSETIASLQAHFLTGRSKLTVVPTFSSLFTETFPPYDSTMLFMMLLRYCCGRYVCVCVWEQLGMKEKESGKGASDGLWSGLS